MALRFSLGGSIRDPILIDQGPCGCCDLPSEGVSGLSAVSFATSGTQLNHEIDEIGLGDYGFQGV
jgi:hypothetical protein